MTTIETLVRSGLGEAEQDVPLIRTGPVKRRLARDEQWRMPVAKTAISPEAGDDPASAGADHGGRTFSESAPP